MKKLVNKTIDIAASAAHWALMVPLLPGYALHLLSEWGLETAARFTTLRWTAWLAQKMSAVDAWQARSKASLETWFTSQDETS